LKRLNTMEACIADAQSFLENPHFWNSFSKQIEARKEEDDDAEMTSSSSDESSDESSSSEDDVKKSPRKKGNNQKSSPKKKTTTKKASTPSKERVHKPKNTPKKESPSKQAKEKRDAKVWQARGSKPIRVPRVVNVQPENAPEIAQVEQKKTMKIVFNTTDLPEVRQSLHDLMSDLISHEKCSISVGIVANRGQNADNTYNLETLAFSTKLDEITQFIQNAYGEGSNWEQYYTGVLDTMSNFNWGNADSKFVMLVGSDVSVTELTQSAVNVNNNNKFQNVVGQLNLKGIQVFAFNHEQLSLLREVITSLH